jgi:ornithine carbamoyltransferase
MVKTETKPKHFLTVTDLTPNELQAVLDAAVELKTRGWITTLKNKTMALVFEKPSLRTRVSFEVAMRQLGG